MNKKFSKLLSIISLVLAMFVSLFAFATCKSNGNNGSNKQPEPEEPQVEITLSTKTLSVEEYKSATIAATVTGSDEAVVWASSDSAVATVDGGTVYGVKEGTATITATVGEISEECSVTVLRTTVAPVLQVETEIRIEENSQYTTAVKTLWEGEELAGVAYEWVDAPEAVSGVCEVVNGENGSVTFNALRAGKTVFTVRTTVRGVFVSKNVEITVIEVIPSITASGEAVKPYEGGYAVELCTLADDEKNTEEELSFTAIFGAQTVENAEITWGNWSEAGVANVEKTANGYKFTKLGVGEAIIEGTYSFAADKTATVTVKVTVEKAVRSIEFGKVIDITKDTTVTVPESVIGDVTGLTVSGKNVFDSFADGVITLNNAAFPKSAKELGKSVAVVISTADCDYECTADVYTLVIKTKEDLDAYPAIAKANGNSGVEGAKGVLLDGYFVLGNDIVYNGRFESPTDTGEIGSKGGRWNDAANNGFKGVFDGMGYNIDGLHVGNAGRRFGESGGFIGFLNNDGIVRNISFTDATVEENSGFICGVGSGLIENVSISFKAIGVGNATTNISDENTYPPITMGAFFSRSAREGATVKNCFVDASGADVKYVYNETKKSGNVRLGTDAAKKNVENLIVVADKAEYLSGSGASVTALTYDGLANEDCAKVVAALPSDVWSVAGNIPFLKHSADKLDKTLQIAITVENEVYAGTDVAVEVNEKYSIVSASDLPDGVMFDGKTLKIDKSVEETTITITARSLINGSHDEKTITVYAAGGEYTLEDGLTIDLKITVVDGAAQSEAENITLDLSSVYTPKAASDAKVIIDNAEYDATISAEGIVSFANTFDINKYGEYTVKVQVGRDVITANAIIVTKLITTADEFAALNTYAAAMEMNGYYMLANDITVGQFDNEIGTSPFRGTIDGNGHIVKSLYIAKVNSSFISDLYGTVKNIAFEDIKLSTYGRVFKKINKGKLENVYFGFAADSSANDGGIIGQWGGDGVILNNVVFDFSKVTADNSKMTLFRNDNYVLKGSSNVVVITKSTSLATSGTQTWADLGMYAYYTDTETNNGVDFPAEGWNGTYWTVTGENVTWKNA